MSEDITGVSLRALEPEDIELLYRWENDSTIWQLSNTLVPFSRYVLTKYIESAHLDIFQTRQLRLMIDIVGENKPSVTIGAIDLFDFEPFHLRAGIGILISEPEYRGKGFADHALSELIKYAFDTLQLNQLFCNIEVDNTTSIKLFYKHGFQEVGIKKMWNKTKAGYKDEIMLQLINARNL
jgi:diamine N-acetyltransferase